MINSKMIKGFLVVMLIVCAINSTQINCGDFGANCGSSSGGACKNGLQCYNGICTKRCGSESECKGLPGRHIACSQGFCISQ